MWSPSEQGTSGSEMAVVSSGPPAELVARTTPVVSTMNISKSSRVHIGPKFVSVTQNVENAELVKGTSLERLLEAEDSETEFDSWREYQEHIHNPRPTTYSCPQYVWTVVRNTSRAERLSCACAALALVLCTALILFFTLVVKRGELNVVDRAPHEWNITREDWLARDMTGNNTVARFAPLKLVVVQHTVSPECHRFTNCAAELRNLQKYFLESKHLGYDIPYNFLIGNDGRVYQGRGWNREGAHTLGFNRCSLGVAFIGDYREELSVHSRVTDLQLQRFNMLLENGVALGFLRTDYSVLPAKDVQDTVSPGTNLYRALQKLDHYERTHSFRGMSCEAIYDKLGLPYHL
ncbi:peptidoglycan recognition protein-like isoform X1 [Cydia amplana]|uniref:peptidoglycan recognition protein-like isoform X1 n=1 Tax=Cydia amplana TaxID=1869771 RepID=UPI002FE61F33